MLMVRLRLLGSSPLARGLLLHDDSFGAVGWIIPARAGFTNNFGGECFERRDHPRSRGVYVPLGRVECAGKGSSPLARGLLQ